VLQSGVGQHFAESGSVRSPSLRGLEHFSPSQAWAVGQHENAFPSMTRSNRFRSDKERFSELVTQAA
jgi:hypothetical protein